jgi:transcriptional regulator with XRE-family HTH domain
MANRPAESFRKNVARILFERGMTINELALLSESSRPTISRVLSGKEQVTLDRAGRIAKALHLDLAELVSTKSKILQETA